MGTPNEEGRNFNTSRIIEAVLIATISSIATSIIMIPRLEERIRFQQQEIDNIQRQVTSIIHDFYVPFGRRAPERTEPHNRDEPNGG